MSFFPVLIAGVLISILMVVALLSLMGGVVAVVLWAKKKKVMETGQSHSKAENISHDKPHDREVNNNMYQNVQRQPAPSSGHSEPDYTTAAGAFINPASATASFKTHIMCNYANEIESQPTEIGGGGVYEEARVEWGGRECFEKSVNGASGKQKKSAVKIDVKPEDLYAEPNKVKKKDAKKDSQVCRSEEAAAPPDALYAQPDMTKKKDQKGQQKSQQERKLLPQAPLPYKQYKEAKHESAEGEDDVPELPPLYIPDEEQHNNNRSDRDGSSSMERRSEYAVLD